MNRLQTDHGFDLVRWQLNECTNMCFGRFDLVQCCKLVSGECDSHEWGRSNWKVIFVKSALLHREIHSLVSLHDEQCSHLELHSRDLRDHITRSPDRWWAVMGPDVEIDGFILYVRNTACTMHQKRNTTCTTYEIFAIN